MSEGNQVSGGSSLPPVPMPPGKSFFHQAATCSVWLLLFPFVMQFISVMALAGMSGEEARWARLFFAVIIGLAMLTGLILGMIAFFGIPKYGTKGILVKALFGVIIPLLLLLASLPVLFRAQELAAQIRAEQQEQANH